MGEGERRGDKWMVGSGYFFAVGEVRQGRGCLCGREVLESGPRCIVGEVGQLG